MQVRYTHAIYDDDAGTSKSVNAEERDKRPLAHNRVKREEGTAAAKSSQRLIKADTQSGSLSPQTALVKIDHVLAQKDAAAADTRVAVGCLVKEIPYSTGGEQTTANALF